MEYAEQSSAPWSSERRLQPAFKPVPWMPGGGQFRDLSFEVVAQEAFYVIVGKVFSIHRHPSPIRTPPSVPAGGSRPCADAI